MKSKFEEAVEKVQKAMSDLFAVTARKSSTEQLVKVLKEPINDETDRLAAKAAIEELKKREQV